MKGIKEAFIDAGEISYPEDRARVIRVIAGIANNINQAVKQSLLIYCKKNQADMILPENVEVKKIPKDLLDKCNFESEVQE